MDKLGTVIAQNQFWCLDLPGLVLNFWGICIAPSYSEGLGLRVHCSLSLLCYTANCMKPLGQKFDSLQSADRAEDDYYRNLSPDERVDLLLELVEQYRAAFDGTAEGFERVFRLTSLEQS